jgi:Helix-turn-helix domain
VNFDSPPAIFSGAECAQVARQLRDCLRLAYLANGLRPPAALVQHADAVTRAAEQFRTSWQAKASSGTSADPTIADWPILAQADHEYLPVAQAARIVGVSESYITRQLRGGHLAGARSGSHRSWWLVDAASLAAWSASRRT